MKLSVLLVVASVLSLVTADLLADELNANTDTELPYQRLLKGSPAAQSRSAPSLTDSAV